MQTSKRYWFLGGLLGVLTYAAWYAFLIVRSQNYPSDFQVYLMSPSLYIIKLFKPFISYEISNDMVIFSLIISIVGFFMIGSILGSLYGKNKNRKQ